MITKQSLYKDCPTYETNCFLLRFVQLEDAEDLLICYSDKSVVAYANSDNCTSDFNYSSLEQMQRCIISWQKAYQEKVFVRFTIVDKKAKRAVGTLELCDSEVGVLRIDVAIEYETEDVIEELTYLATHTLFTDFELRKLVIKVSNTKQRLCVFKRIGFVPSTFRQDIGYYEYKNNALAYCGLACCLCSEKGTCIGCRNAGCLEHDTCINFNCCREKGLVGCWECSEFPCDSNMLKNLRIRAFAQFAKQYGENNLIRCLLRNQKNGIVYHPTGTLVGDYDKFQTEEEIIEFIRFGKKMLP